MKRSLLLALPLVLSAASAAVARPNVVMIVADDQAFTDFGFMGTLGNPAGDVVYRWVRDRNLKLIVPHCDDTGKAWNRYVDRTTLFDVENDPGEAVDLSGKPDYGDDIERLTRLLDQWWRARDD